MKVQKYEKRNQDIKKAFLNKKKNNPDMFQRNIDMSFCTLMFGLESVAHSIERLAKYGYQYIEILGNCAGDHIGSHTEIVEIKKALEYTGIKCSGICLNFQQGFSLESTDFFARQRAYDYVKRNAEFCVELGGSYCLITPAATGGVKPAADGGDFDRSVIAMREIGEIFSELKLKCAIEPIAKHITPIVHTFKEAMEYIGQVNHPYIQYIYGDTEHMLAGEEHIGKAIVEAGDKLLNIHLKDTHAQRPIGNGMLDVDTIIRSLYLIGFNTEGHYATGEPLPDYYNPVAGYGTMIYQKEEVLDILAKETIQYFREREKEVLNC